MYLIMNVCEVTIIVKWLLFQMFCQVPDEIQTQSENVILSIYIFQFVC